MIGELAQGLPSQSQFLLGRRSKESSSRGIQPLPVMHSIRQQRQLCPTGLLRGTAEPTIIVSS